MFRVSLEGLDGSGKSTQAELLVEGLKKTNSELRVGFFHEPRVLRTEMFDTCKLVGKEPHVNDAFISYILAKDGYLDRKEELQQLPYGSAVYMESSVIIRDRDTTISQYAYHHNMGTQDEFMYAMAWIVNKINGVDLVIFVDTPLEICLNRIRSRASTKAVVDYFEKEEKLRRVHANYIELLNDKQRLEWMGLDKTKIVMVNGDQSIETLNKEIMGIFLENYNIAR
jgi:thymidylate kinase